MKNHRRTSDLLGVLLDDQQLQDIAIEDLVTRLGDRVYGILFLVLALVTCIPAVPGFTIVIGLAMAAVALQLMLGRAAPWLPRSLRRYRLNLSKTRGAMTGTIKLLQRIESVCRPRLGVLTSMRSERMLGFLIFYMALIIALPIPFFGNFPPAMAIMTLALGLLEHDGLIVLLGVGLSSLAIVVTWAIGAASVAAVLGVVGAAFS